MDKTLAEQFLIGEEGPGASNLNAPLPGLQPPSIAGATGQMTARENYLQRNQQPGIPLDIDSGIGAWQNLMLDFRRNKENQIAYLESKYGKDKVRLDESGDYIVRVPDENDPGKFRDILAKPHGKLTFDDFLALSAFVPEIAGSIAAVRYARMVPLLKKGGMATDIAAGAVGGETAGAAKDVGFNVLDRGVLDLPEVAKERAKMGLTDVAIGAASYPIAKFFQLMKNPLHTTRSEVQFDALKAREYFKNKYGIDVPLTIGESTGSPLASRTEIFVEKLPGGTQPIRQIKNAQEESFRRLQRIMLGGTPPADEAFGENAIKLIQSGTTGPATTAATAASENLAKQAENEILAIMQASAPGRQLYKEKVGKEVRDAVIAARDAVKSEADRLYGIVRSIPGGTGKIFDGAQLQADLAAIRKDLPAPSVTVNSSIIGPTGAPLTTRQPEILRQYTPPPIISKIDEILSLKDPKFSLSDLQQMRREIYTDMAVGRGVPGLGEHWLSKIGNALTKAIDDGVSALPTGDLKNALTAANAYYKNKVVPFDRKGLTQLFAAADEGPFVSDAAIVNRLTTGENAIHNWQMAKETLPKPVFDNVKRTVLDSLIENARMIGNDTLDAAALADGLKRLRVNSRTIYDDVIGSTGGRQLDEALTALKYQQGGKVDRQQLENLLRTGSLTAQKVQILRAAQQKRDELYKNELFKAIGSGEVTEETLKPVDFVNRLLDRATPSEVKQVMTAIGSNPALVEELKQKTFEKIFRDAARKANTGDVHRILAGDASHILSGVKIAESMKNSSYRRKIESILGPEGIQDLEQYAKLQTAPEMKEAGFSAAGGLAAGMEIARAERTGLLSLLGSSARNFVFSTILSKPPLRTWLTRVPEEPGKWALLFSNPLFIKAVSNEFGEGADAFMWNLKGAVDKYAQTQGGTPQNLSNSPVLPFSDKRLQWMKELDQITPKTTP